MVDRYCSRRGTARVGAIAGAAVAVPALLLFNYWLSRRSTEPLAVRGREAQPRYRATDLGTLGGPESHALGINNNGDVVGEAQTASVKWHACLWHAGKIQDLGTLGGDSSQAAAINNRGDVVGRAEVSHSPVVVHAFLFREGAMKDLGSLATGSWARAINNRGEVVGASSVHGQRYEKHAFLYANAKMTDLGKLPGAKSSEATSINDRGEVVGWSDNGAFVYRGRAVTRLPTLGGKTAFAFGIDQKGRIGGYSRTQPDDDVWSQRVCIWTGDRAENVGHVGKGQCVPGAMNNRDDMVGIEWEKNGSAFAFCRVNGRFWDFRQLETGCTVVYPKAINDRGQIAANALVSGRYHAVLLTPIR